MGGSLGCVEKGTDAMDFTTAVTCLFSKCVEVGCLSLKAVDWIPTEQIAHVLSQFLTYSVERSRQLK